MKQRAKKYAYMHTKTHVHAFKMISEKIYIRSELLHHKPILKRITNHNFTATKTMRYVDMLPDLVYSYNHSVHHSIKTKPADVLLKTKRKCGTPCMIMNPGRM